MASTKMRRRDWDRGRVLVDLGLALADGVATTITDLAMLRNQPALFGEVTSLATAQPVAQASRRASERSGPIGPALTLGRPRVGYCWCELRRVGRCRRVCAAVGSDG